MHRALLTKLRPLGPWRYGPADGAHDRVDTLYRSDRLFSALTLAMRQLGHLDLWLEATARASSPAVVLTSLFPFQADTLFAPPPATLWPPPAGLVTTPSPGFLIKVRWAAARFVPVSLVESLLNGHPVLADQWAPDADSGCLLRRDRPNSSPFRTVLRSVAAVDRLTNTSAHLDTTACVEFEAGAGLWSAARFTDRSAESAWSERLKAAFRLLADTGFGGRRSSGWGQTSAPEFSEGAWPSLLMPRLKQASADADAHSSSYWLLSLYSPSSSDSIDWSGGFYEVAVRGGRVESSSRSGALKKQVRMVLEGSVMSASRDPIGAAVDVAPEGFAHPVYRSGLALALKLPAISIAPAPAREEEVPAAPAEPDAAAPDPVIPEETPVEPIPSIDEQLFDFTSEEREPPAETIEAVAEMPAEETIPDAGSDPQPAAFPDPLTESTPEGGDDLQPAAVPEEEAPGNGETHEL